MAFALRRARQHAGRLSLIALVVALLVAGIGGIDAVAERMLAEGASRVFTDAEPGARTIRVVADEASDAAAQDEAVRREISAAFAGERTVVSRRASADVELAAAGGSGPSLGMLDDDRVPDLATLAAGTWPRTNSEIALSVAAAERLELGVGDTVPLAGDAEGTELTLVGTWTPDDPTDPAWLGDPAVVSGESDGSIGPALVAEGALNAYADTVTVIWEIALSRVEPADIPALQSALVTLRSLPEAVDPRNEHSTGIQGDLGDTLQRLGAALATTRGLHVAPLLILALLGALVLGIVLSSQTDARGEELALLRARGASVRRLALAAAAETAICAAVGASPAVAVLAATTGVTAAMAWTAAGAIGFAALAAALFTVRHVVGVRPAAERSDAGARTLAALLLPTGIVVGIAALSAWQLFALGAVVRDDGTPEPLAAAAPALLLVAACALIPVAAGPLAAGAERLLRRTRGIAPILPLRQVARRMGGVAVAILCLALAAASVALAATAPVVAGRAEQRALTTLLGGDVRLISESAIDVSADTASSWSGVTTAAEILDTPLTVGADTGVLVAGPASAVGFGGHRKGDGGPEIDADVTRRLADRLDAEVGTAFAAQIRFVPRPVTVRIARIVDIIPGAGSGLAIATTPEELRAADVDLPANELWLRSEHPTSTAEQLRAHATQPVQILTAAQVSAVPVTSVATRVLTAGALLAALLGVIGFIAATSAMNRTRRGEERVLLALGLAPPRRRALRTGEGAGLAVYAVVAGGAVGAGIAAAVLPITLGAGA
ncbi:hypothetical protein [Microbacterium arabinogalactanolyticum]|uniref:FtsX-like permease family protein n=1 Tax=Microbacterium arabinogalactanolyticum TaxID=69365 RepID=A0ABQ5ND60_9MICO|nr:hypothetical protein [Microbacterium arabinogalactanolyticum]GLC83733.1 hypothetical protein MIAR_03210 [Microbacterium arabinogalactanolyticum]